MCLSDLRLPSPLHQLRSLSLEGWTLDPVHLHHVLSNNADHLEELVLGNGDATIISPTPPINEQWNGLHPSARSSMTREQQAEANKMIQGQSLLVPKLKSLHLRPMWCRTSDAAYSLVRAFPALEAITLNILDEEIGTRLDISARRDGGIPCIIGACAPATLVNVALARWRFDNRLRDALMQHQDRLEVLELTLYHLEISAGVLENIGKVLAGCKRLTKFSLYNFRRSFQIKDTSIILDGLKDCLDLKSLTLVGFPFIDRTLFDIEEEQDRFDQFMRDTQNEVPVSKAVLPPGWRYCPKFVVGPNSTMSTSEFRDMTFQVVSHLPFVKTIVLNDDRFEKRDSLTL
ncbi:hypothetical protein BGW39_002159 [Mortierella sp. 14UC]|nr:hypothetical protein BGW39_002159 [Mortierella sp. 14UC]